MELLARGAWSSRLLAASRLRLALCTNRAVVNGPSRRPGRGHAPSVGRVAFTFLTSGNVPLETRQNPLSDKF
jgi:hypothetical protein